MIKTIILLLALAIPLMAQRGEQAILTQVAVSGGPPAFVQATTNCVFGGTATTTAIVGGSSTTSCPTGTGWTSNVTAGDTLVGMIRRKPGGGTLNSVGDGGDTCVAENTSGTAGSSGLYLIYGFYCYNVAGGNKPTITTTFGTAEGTYYVEAVEVSGVLTTNPLDAQVWYAAATFVNPGTNAAATGSWVTNTNGDMIVCFFQDDGEDGRTITAGTISLAWNAIGTVDNTHSESMFAEYGVQATASATTNGAFTTAVGLVYPQIGCIALLA